MKMLTIVMIIVTITILLMIILLRFASFFVALASLEGMQALIEAFFQNPQAIVNTLAQILYLRLAKTVG